jgi:hypothetical protein
MKKEEKALDKVPGTDIALPDWLKQDVGKGGLNTGNEMSFGFVKLLQALSPEVSGEGKIADPGNMLNSLTQSNYGKELTFIPLMDNKEAIRWNPRADGGGIACQSKDLIKGTNGTCAGCEFNFDNWKRGDLSDDEKKKSCTLYLNFPSLINGEDMPTIVAFEKTKYREGAKLKLLYVNQCTTIGVVPIYAMKFRLTVREDKRPLGKFFNYSVSFAGMCSQEEYLKAKKWAEGLKGINVKIDEKTPF